MRINKKPIPIRTHEGAVAQRINPELQLKRSVMACMLWEDSFYEDGISIAERISNEIKQVKNETVAQYAVEARTNMHLRHIPLLLAVELAKRGGLKAELLETIIQRPDELTEFLALYWKEKRCPLSKQVKLGLARAFRKFNAYQLAKYNCDDAIKLRDVLFLCHAKPKDKEQELVWKKLIDGTLESPDTWEVSLSTGKNKKETWERLLKEGKLGGFALLRNLRNMAECGVDEILVKNNIGNIKATNILPFRFIAAARYAPQWEFGIEKAMLKCLKEQPKFNGKTIILVDVSGSMDGKLNEKSDMNRIDAACGLAVICRELCDNIAVYAFSTNLRRIPDRKGFALRDAISNSMPHSSTNLGGAINYINSNETYDRIIVITDEQSRDSVSMPNSKGYMINVASYENGVGYGKWIHLDGFSEAIVNYIREYESSFQSE